jgi:predicted LPLAT superfamily acyltransferase
VVAYFGGSQKIRRVLDELNPGLAASIIDPTEPDAVFRMRDVVERGGILAILGDRVGIGEKRLPVDFLGEAAQLPAGPYFLAAIMHCPVYCFFGLRVGDHEYDTYIIRLADRIRLSRGGREEEAALYAQRYADLLAEKARQYPYNWFNFYEFWSPQLEDRR